MDCRKVMVVALLCIFFAVPSHAGIADLSLGFTGDDFFATGNWVIYEGKQPGQILSGTVHVTGYRVPTRLSIKYGSKYPYSDFSCGFPPYPVFDLGSWMNVPVFNQTIYPGETASLTYSFTIPPDAVARGYGACLWLEDLDRPGFLSGIRIYLTLDGTATKTTDNAYLLAKSKEERFEFADIDADGDLDKFASGRFYRNDGNSLDPVFTLMSSNYAELGDYAKPTFADIDGDGLLEMLVPGWERRVSLYRNQGTARVPVWTLDEENFLVLSTDYIEDFSLHDLDADSDLDALVTSRWGRLYFFLNEGTPYDPNFVLVAGNYLETATDLASYPAAPPVVGTKRVAFLDTDNDGVEEMIVGVHNGLLLFRRNPSSDGKQWIYVPDGFSGAGYDFNCYPSVGDLNGDSGMELYVACQLGQYYQSFGPPVLPVAIDIKPDDHENTFNNNERGAIPVAIFGSESLVVWEIDSASVVLDGLPVKVAGKSNKYLAHITDLNGDGYEDLLIQINDSDLVYAQGCTTAHLTGVLQGGLRISGSDEICIVP